jgi:hypothetical protein
MPAGAAAYCQASLIRLKPGLQFSDVWITCSTFIRRPYDKLRIALLPAYKADILPQVISLGRMLRMFRLLEIRYRLHIKLPSNQQSTRTRATGATQHVPVYHLCVLGVLCGYGNKSVSGSCNR